MKIFASLLSISTMSLKSCSELVVAANIDGLHVDIMDGHYVSELSFGTKLCDDIRKVYKDVYIDAHLMTSNPRLWINQLVNYGVNSISFHPDASSNLRDDLEYIKQHGIKAGLAINPDLAIKYGDHQSIKYKGYTFDIDSVIDLIDSITIMSVHPGKGSQEMIQSTYSRITHLATKLLNLDVEIIVDGGVKLDNIVKIKDLGANICIIGSGIFGKSDISKAVIDIRNKII